MEILYWIVLVGCFLHLTDAQRIEDRSRCVFPFKYKGKLYSTCITRDHSKLWCSTTEDYDTDRRWRDCRAVLSAAYGSDEDLYNLPTFNESTNTNITAIVGEAAVLPCVIHNLNAKQVSWQKEGSPYPLTVATSAFLPNGKVSVRNSIPEEWSLVIHNVTKSDRGMYQCRVVTQALSLVREVRLFVKGSKYGPLMTTPGMTYFEQEGQRNIHLPKGDNLTISCNSTNPYYVKGQSQIIHHNYIVWYKNSKKVDSNTKTGIMITNYVKDEVARSELTIEGIKPRHTGNYYCICNETTIAKFNVYLKGSDPKMSQDQPLEGSNYGPTPYLDPNRDIPDSLKVSGNTAPSSIHSKQIKTTYISLLIVISVRTLNLLYI